MTTAALNSAHTIDPQEYKRRIWAWTMYDWANSAFATTILAAVLPVYFSQVAGATLPSATVATTYWSTGLGLSLLIIAVISPILGTISDVMRGKKRFLAIFAGIGIVSTALLYFVETGDWVMASILGIIGRIGFNGANTFYDALLPHVAREQDQDAVSARGYAMGYLGGGILLAINIVMIQLLPGTLGARLSFVSVAVWWAVFTIPLLRRVPEPPAATVVLSRGDTILSVSFKRIADTVRNIRRYKELFKFLISFLIYNDGIGTIIGVAAIYGAELGFGATELILALLLVQFVGIPYALIFGRLPSSEDKRRSLFLAFIVLNAIALPLCGVAGARWLPASISGARPAPYLSTATSAGEGLYPASDAGLRYQGEWQTTTIPADVYGGETELLLKSAMGSGASVEFPFNGQKVELSYSMGPDQGIWAVYIDGQPLKDPDSAQPFILDAYNATPRYQVSETLQAETPGEHILRLESSAQKNPASQGAHITLHSVKVLPPIRESNLGMVIGLVIGLEIVCLLLAFLLARPLFGRFTARLDTKHSILLALVIYSVVAVWGFFIDSVIEFWFLAWMVAIVQGGSQALSRSLYAAMSPAAKSGEFFGLFGIMEKFSAIIGPTLFAAAGIAFGSSRPAVLSLIVIFFVGGFLLMRVDVEEGKSVAHLEDAELLERE